MRGRTALATKLAADACDGSDPPVLLPLPHTGALAAMDAGRRANVPRGAGPAQDEWPAGCLGFAVNLVRPVVRGHRSTVFLSLLGRCVIFETMSQAAAYRTYVTQVLGSGSIGDLYTLDGRRMSGRGVISGSNHRVYELEDAPCRFGSVPAGQSAATQALTQQAQGLEALAEALAAKEAADCALAAAEKALEGAQAAYERGQQQLRAESERLKAEIEAMQGGGGGGAASAELEQQQQQPAAKAAGGGSKRRRSEVLAADAPPPAGTDGADAEAAAVAEEEETAAADGGGKSRKAQRRTGAAPGGGGNSKRMGAMQG